MTATWSKPDIEDIAQFDTREAAKEAIDKLNASDRYGWLARPQFVGSLYAWTVEGNRRSNRYGNPHILRTDGTMRKVWP